LYINILLLLLINSFGGEVKPSVPCRRSAACKNKIPNGVNRDAM